ncbi:MAG: endolytic transglycosylase MltG [Oscillospiraceae bacterium]
MDNENKDFETEFKDSFIIGQDFVIETKEDDNDDVLPEIEEISDKSPHELLKEKKSKKKRNKGCLGAMVWIVVIFVISACLATVAVVVSIDYLGIGNSGNYQIEVAKGSSTTQIAKQLKDVGVIRSEILFRVYSKLKKYDGTFKYGVYSFTGDKGYDSLAKMLQEEGAEADTVEVLIPECATIDQISKILADKGVCTEGEFKKVVQSGDLKFDFISEIPTNEVYYRLEGYLYPDKYMFYSFGGENCAKLAVEKMLKNFESKITPQMRAKATDMGYTLHQIMTMASIIDLEASSGSDIDKQKVSAVFYNRLAWTDQPNLLGSSPTAKYPYGSGRYDTNKAPGLPPGPLCTASIASVTAALNPTADFSATYFVTDKDMIFYYNENYNDHLKTIKSLKNQGKWLG